jgi:secreted PhoX family phosphatase
VASTIKITRQRPKNTFRWEHFAMGGDPAVATPDRKTMLCGIQHPGEAPSGANSPANPKQYSSWPDGDMGARPRSATLVITKDDGGEIGT